MNEPEKSQQVCPSCGYPAYAGHASNCPAVSKSEQEAKPEEVESRKYTAEDIQNFQGELSQFEKMRKADNANYVFEFTQYYQFLTQHKKSQERPFAEKDVPTKGYQDLEVGLFNGWKQNLLAKKDILVQSRPKLTPIIRMLESEPTPKTLDELRDLFRKHPDLNEFGAVQYQDGVGEQGEKKSGFLHINMSRYNGYEYELPKTDTRVYLNPLPEAIPQISMELCQMAQAKRFPLYFKTIDYSFQKPNPDNTNRLDKFIVYTDKAHVAALSQELKILQAQHPEWFNGRELPTMVAKMGEGVGVAEDPNQQQMQKFGERGKSFNGMRALFLKDVWTGATKDIILGQRTWRPRGGRTMEEIFNDNLKAGLTRRQLQPNVIADVVSRAWVAQLDGSRMGNLPDSRIADEVDNAVARTMADVIPKITPDSLQPAVQNQINKKAKDYFINPTNLAFNQ